MANVHIVREHNLGLPEARALAKKWVSEGEENLFLSGEYHEGENEDLVTFSRIGVSGELAVNAESFILDLELGFLFSVYEDRIVETIHANMDELLGERSENA